MSVTVTMNMHVTHDDVADWASRREDAARTATARMLTTGAENREARDEVLIRLHDLRGSIEVIKGGVVSETLADTQTARGSFGFGTPACYQGLLFMLHG